MRERTSAQSHFNDVCALVGHNTPLEVDPKGEFFFSFETFPFPWSPGQEPVEDRRVKAIAAHAKASDDFRAGWLKSVEGHVGVTVSEKTAYRYTLTNLYNALAIYREEYKGRQRDPRLWAGSPYGNIISLEQVETLDHIHMRLDQAAWMPMAGRTICPRKGF